jgi:hypothetical protein
MLFAYQNDEGLPMENLHILFRRLGPLLPCRFCRESYPVLLAAVEKDIAIEVAIESKQMVKFVYDLHNKVNRKLALQRLENLKSYCNIFDTEKMLQVLDNHPSFDIVQKRNLLFKEDPLNFEAVLLILIVLLQRSDEIPVTYLLFICTIRQALLNVGLPKYQEFGLRLPIETLDTDRLMALVRMRELFKLYFQTDTLQTKLDLMVSGSCIKGTCI